MLWDCGWWDLVVSAIGCGMMMVIGGLLGDWIAKKSNKSETLIERIEK